MAETKKHTTEAEDKLTPDNVYYNLLMGDGEFLLIDENTFKNHSSRGELEELLNQRGGIVSMLPFGVFNGGKSVDEIEF